MMLKMAIRDVETQNFASLPQGGTETEGTGRWREDGMEEDKEVDTDRRRIRRAT